MEDSLGNIKPMQLRVEQMCQASVELPSITDNQGPHQIQNSSYRPSSCNDDDADMNLRYTALSAASSSACCMLLSCSATSSLMYVIHVFGCRPWLLSPSTWQCNTLSGNRSPSILVTCPNDVSRRFLTSDSSCCNILRTVSFLILSFSRFPRLSLALDARDRLGCLGGKVGGPYDLWGIWRQWGRYTGLMFLRVYWVKVPGSSDTIKRLSWM